MNLPAPLLLKLLTAHLVGDYLFQTDWVAARKRRWPVLALHGLGHAALLAGVALTEPRDSRLVLALALLLLAHLAIDAWTSRSRREGTLALLLDQSLHAATILAAVAFARPSELAGLGGTIGVWLQDGRTFAVIAGFVAAVWMGAVVVGRWVKPFTDRITDGTVEGRSGLRNAGRAIGILERGLIFIAILVGLEALVGFVVAAKALLRLPEARERASRELSEYYLVGTLASVFWAVMVSLLTRWAVRGSP